MAGCGKLPPTIVVHEFYNAKLDRYFHTANAAEAAALKGDPASGESDTGHTFLAYPANDFPKEAVPVCRFYGSVAPGPNSHFYTADPGECERLKQLQQTVAPGEKRWNFEEIAFAVRLPVGETCPVDAPVPVFRAYNDGFTKARDSNHRLTTDPAIYREMLSKGWIGEHVVMCTPSR
jgi:hypothetical protein